jgi:hypothetical protein
MTIESVLGSKNFLILIWFVWWGWLCYVIGLYVGRRHPKPLPTFHVVQNDLAQPRDSRGRFTKGTK